MKDDKNAPATKGDIDDLAESINDLTSMAAKNFDEVRGDITDLQVGQERIERKLDPTVNRLDEHNLRISKLENRAA